MITKFKKPVAASGSTIENEPIIKSDGASSDLMEWQASTGSSTVKIREGSGNTVVLDVDGSLELADKIKSVTSATTVGAVHIYDTSQDSDGGAWRKKCKGLSWFDEAASATRSARSEFPAMALIVADNASSGTKTLTIYDLDDPAMPVWMVFNVLDNNLIYQTNSINTVTALNGRVYIGRGTWGLAIADFCNDSGISVWRNSSSFRYSYKGNIADRNAISGVRIDEAGTSALVNNTINDVAATVLEGAEIGALGLPIPTVAVATAGGLSVIHANGSVYDSSTTSAMEGVDFLDGGKLAVRRDNSGSSIVNVYDPNYWADSFAATGATFVETTHGSASSYIPNFIGSNPITKHANNNNLAIGTEAGLNRYKFNAGNPAESAVAHITSDYNTGYMVGDIRGAWLAYGISSGVSHADHVQSAFSVKANTLTETGTLTKTAVATGADLTGFSGWSASNYLSRASDTDFDFGTGDFSVIFWVKYSSASSGEYLFMRDTTGGSSNKFAIYTGGSNFTVYAGTETDISALDVDDGSWHQIGLVRTGGTLYTLEDGKYGASGTASTSTVTNGAAVLHIGQSTGAAAPATNASMSLFRISATAPTPQQIKEIYDAEKPLFAANAKCLLQSPHASLSNVVNDLSYDKSTGLLAVAQTAENYGVQLFRGLEMIEATSYEDSTSWSSSTASLISTAGGVVAPFREHADGGVLVDLPALDVRAELNDGDDKLPDDGKLHFSGVTTDATGTTIGVIPIAENETVSVNATIKAQQYNDQDGEWLFADSKRTFYRDIGGARAQRAVSYSLTDESTASMSAGIGGGTNSIVIEVTGKAATRLVWTAEVEVQRISDKTYER